MRSIDDRSGRGLSNAIANIVLVAMRAAVAKWVDDFFCCHRQSVAMHGMAVLDELLALLGMQTDSEKAVSCATEMEVLGVHACINNELQYVSTRLSADKAKKYSHHLEQCGAADYMTPGEAQKIASRFQFAERKRHGAAVNRNRWGCTAISRQGALGERRPWR